MIYELHSSLSNKENFIGSVESASGTVYTVIGVRYLATMGAYLQINNTSADITKYRVFDTTVFESTVSQNEETSTVII